MGFESQSSIYPPQKLSRKEKDEKWYIQNINYFLNLSTPLSLGTGYATNAAGEVSDYANMAANYDLVNNIVNENDFNYVTHPYGENLEFPAKLRHHDLISPKMKVLLGEEIKKPFEYKVVVTNEEAVSEIEEQRKEMLLQAMEQELIESMKKSGLIPPSPQQDSSQDPSSPNTQSPTPPSPIENFTQEEIAKYQNYSFNDLREVTANRVLEYLHKDLNLDFLFNKGFKHGLISGCEFYYIGTKNGEPIVECINPLDFFYNSSLDTDEVEKAQFGVYIKYCKVHDIINQYFSQLTEEQLNILDTGTYFSASTSNLGEGGITDRGIPITYGRPQFRDHNGTGYIRVAILEWVSLRKVGFLKYFDENLEEQEMVVDETYVPNAKSGEVVEWKWISEVHTGTKIGDGIYIDMKPKELQFRTNDNPSECKLGFFGGLYNNLNSRNTSFVDYLKTGSYLYDIIWYRLELEIAKAKGKKMVVDLAQIPKSQGMDLEKWMYYFDSVGLAFINSFEEGTGSMGQGRTSSFNQFTSVDMSLSQSVGQYITILDKIERMIEDLSGVSHQRQGSVANSETVGGVHSSIVQSSFVTEPIFYRHNEIKKNVLSGLIEAAKYCWKEGGKKINYIMDNMSRMIINISDQFLNADYGLFVSNQARDTQVLEGLRALANQAIASGTMSLKEATVILQSNSIAEIKNTIEQSEAAKQEEQATQQQYQLQQIEANKQAALAQIQFTESQKNQREQDKNAALIEIAQINSFKGAKNDDVNQDSIPDQLELAKFEQKKQDDEEERRLMERITDKKIEAEKYKADKAAEVARAQIASATKNRKPGQS